MGKIKIIFLTVFFIVFSAQAGYIRKLKEPNFFIPEGQGMHIQEKLPPLNVPEKKIIEKEDVFSEIPEYKKKYDDYLQDIKFFVKTNEMPSNEELEQDLNAMESGEVFEVTQNTPQEIKTKEQKEFFNLLKDVMKN